MSDLWTAERFQLKLNEPPAPTANRPDGLRPASFVYDGPRVIKLEVAPPLLSAKRVSRPVQPAQAAGGAVRDVHTIAIGGHRSHQEPAAWAAMVRPSTAIDLPVETGDPAYEDNSEVEELTAMLHEFCAQQGRAVPRYPLAAR